MVDVENVSSTVDLYQLPRTEYISIEDTTKNWAWKFSEDIIPSWSFSFFEKLYYVQKRWQRAVMWHIISWQGF